MHLAQEENKNSVLEDEVITLVREQLSQPGRKGYVWRHA